jgi:hypothetical protein
MAPLSLIMIGCAIVGLDMASAHTDTCSEEIARVALVDQSMGNPIAKPTTAQSVDAQLHHQPTQRSVRTAGENAQSMFAAILARAKALNADGKTDECIQSVAEGRVCSASNERSPYLRDWLFLIFVWPYVLLEARDV